MDFNIALKQQEPKVIDPMDPKPLLKMFSNAAVEIESMALKANSHEITDESSNITAVEMITQAQKLISTISKKQKVATEPYHHVKSTVDRACKTLKDRLTSIKGVLNRKITPYMKAKEDERRAAEHKAQADAKKEQDRLAEIQRKEQARREDEARAKAESENKSEEEVQADIAAVEVAEPAPVVVAQAIPEVKTITETGTANLKKKTVWKITDFTSLPEQLFIDREKQIKGALAPWINARIKAGVLEIPGVKISEVNELQTSVRR